MDPQKTHREINGRLCGIPVSLKPGQAEVELELIPEMAADEKGLVHGGFTFGLADYAAMLAVNEPTVVLGKATTKFLRPTVVGDHLVARATVQKSDGTKRIIQVTVLREEKEVFSGEFACFVPHHHVLDR